MDETAVLGAQALAGDLAAALAASDDGSAAARWRRAWLLTAAGRYGQALALCATARTEPRPEVAARLLVTRASLLRQVALHERAEASDREALAIAPDRESHAAARIGLVADAVGRGAGGGELHERLDAAVAATTRTTGWRQRLRVGWVTGEVAMVDGRAADAAQAFADAARRARRARAARHLAKSRIFRAVAAFTLGDAEHANAVAATGRDLAERCGARPLLWSADVVLADFAAGLGRDVEAAHLRRRAAHGLGELLDSLPPAHAAAARTRPPAAWLLS